jgi:CubicO group peptidase (beta-lactamase class C family)/imidazolonepropionase-like amidohydrolase
MRLPETVARLWLATCVTLRRMRWPSTRALAGAAAAAFLLGAQGPEPSIDALFKDFSAEGTPGCAAGATRDGRTLFARGFGLADLEHRTALTAQSVFYMASVSKQFMALAILLLEQDGKLRLDDAVRRHVPELPEHAASITLRHLLQHTSGLRDYLTLTSLAGRPPDYVITEPIVLQTLSRQKRLNFEPGSEHLYSNSGYVLLSIVAQRVTGRRLDEWARERIFSPLGMQHTRFQHDHAAPIPGRANGYVRANEGWRVANSMLDAFAGAFYSAELDATYRLFSEGDQLRVEIGARPPVTLGLIGPDRLRMPSGAELIPTRDGTGAIVGFALNAGRVRNLAFARAEQTKDTFLRSERWLDPISGALKGPVVIQVTGERIAKVIPAGDFDGKGTVIDLGSATILPGLIDGHVHLQIGGAPNDNARAILHAGFTTVVDLGSTSDSVLRLRDRINKGEEEGPRILAAGKWVGTKDGICEFGGIGVAGGPDAFRARVRENVDAEADLIKVCVSTWLADAFAKSDAYEIQDAALAAAVEESHKAKRLTIAHAISLGSVKAALRAQVDGLAHGALIDRATALEMNKRGMFMMPTLASLVGDRQGPAAQALRRAIADAHAAGVRLVFGTDGGVLPHGQNAREFAAMVDAGVPVVEAIRAATINAARTLGLEKDIGAIAAGRAADIIAVDGDPLRDVQSLSRVVFVMRKGRVIRRPA